MNNPCINKHTGKAKVHYRYYDEAEKDALIKQKEHPDKTYWPYKCTYCGNYHLTTATPKKMPPSMDKQIKLESEAKFWTKRLFKKRKKI